MLLPKNSYARICDNQDVQILFWNDECAAKSTTLATEGYHQLFAFCKGSGIHEIAFTDHKIRDCSFHLVPAGTPHMFRTLRRLKGIAIHFTDAYWKRLNHFDYAALEDGEGDEKYIFEASLSEFRKLYDAMLPLANDLLKQRSQTILLNLITVMLLQIIRSHHLALDTERYRFVSDLHNKVDKHLQCNYKRKPVLSAIARELNMADEQLNYSLKVYLQSSLLQLQRRKILRTAKEMLCNTRLNTASIAKELGFSSEYEFLKFFRKHTGMGPEVYKINYYTNKK